jgi:hypothetical protein
VKATLAAQHRIEARQRHIEAQLDALLEQQTRPGTLIDHPTRRRTVRDAA